MSLNKNQKFIRLRLTTPKGLSKQAQRTACMAEALYTQKELSINEITQQLGISKTTLYKYLRDRNVVIFSEKQ